MPTHLGALPAKMSNDFFCRIKCRDVPSNKVHAGQGLHGPEIHCHYRRREITFSGIRRPVLVRRQALREDLAPSPRGGAQVHCPLDARRVEAMVAARVRFVVIASRVVVRPRRRGPPAFPEQIELGVDLQELVRAPRAVARPLGLAVEDVALVAGQFPHPGETTTRMNRRKTHNKTNMAIAKLNATDGSGSLHWPSQTDAVAESSHLEGLDGSFSRSFAEGNVVFRKRARNQSPDVIDVEFMQIPFAQRICETEFPPRSTVGIPANSTTSHRLAPRLASRVAP